MTRPPFGHAFAARYNSVLAVVAVLVLFTFLPTFAWLTGLVAVPPLYFALPLAVAALPLVLSGRIRGLVMSPTAAWAWAYGSALLVWFLFADQTASTEAYQLLQTRALGLGMVLLAYLVLADGSALRTGRIALAVAVGAAALLNFYEVLHPGVFSGVPGRSAGFYGNPTISGSALVGGMTLTMWLFDGWKQFVYVLMVGAATLATLSRAAILGWLLVVLIFVLTQHGLLGRLRSIAAAGCLLLALVVFVGSDWQETTGLLPSEVRSSAPRLGVGFVYSASAEFSANERIEVARAAWRLFSENPISGAGLGATMTWDLRASAHNMYLLHLAEFGILGILILPGLAWSLYWRTGAPERRTLVLFVSYLLFAGLFTHNALDHWESAFTIGMGAALANQARTRRGRASRHA